MLSEKRIKRIEDRFWEKIIAYVEKNSHMLFSDYTGNTSQMERAIMYVAEIFCTRTEVANTKGEMPTNVHELVACAFHESQNTQWKDCTIQRHIDASEQWNDDFFKPFARKLKEQSEKLADNLSTKAKNRRAEYGPFWINALSNRAIMADELSLQDALSVTPLPMQQLELISFLPESPQIPKDRYVMILKVILQNRNDPYGLMVAIGIDPTKWLSNDKEFHLSTSKLEQLKVLTQAFKCQKNVTQGDDANRFKALFNGLKDNEEYDGIKCKDFNGAGFKGADDCYDFYRFYINPDMIPIINGSEGEDEGGLTPEQIDGLHIFDSQADEELEAKLDEHPEWFNPVIAYVYRQILVGNANLADKKNAEKLLKDQELHRLILDNPQLDYPTSPSTKLLAKLSKELIEIIEKL